MGMAEVPPTEVSNAGSKKRHLYIAGSFLRSVRHELSVATSYSNGFLLHQRRGKDCEGRREWMTGGRSRMFGGVATPYVNDDERVRFLVVSI
ncbi:uncharacterized protein LACBIDRAFT_304904 [Laccaria bicolor S238N-H82]|uniref:Predicted protein n=1 Tax=Laccaria bicolor (strain S238N-H82 / ATCC MYA-4686) TaxID=486041 RepID=B0DML5_LACBS|nr:uncharacterized protein LACBIDRAFT_304904 [Laccaria bicolor S238N-H82]EDR04308.1 predicted protein [Laccaria bicolor S238N-H82]|eukprot:XP_001885199.1 predicted protein [Laccaria bicolor S238N-H82]